MKEIGNIYLTWRKGRGSVRIPVGIIRNNATQGVRFQYIPEEVKKAAELGFVSYEGFPDIDKTYTENVIEIFGQRLIKSERVDTKAFYDFWGISPAFKDDNYYMLAFTQGILPTDNFEFLTDFNLTPSLQFVTEITGLTGAKLPPDSLKIGDFLTYELEPENPYDNKAVKLYKGDLYLGHVKLIHSRVFYKTNKTLSVKVQHIEKNGVLNRAFIKVSS